MKMQQVLVFMHMCGTISWQGAMTLVTNHKCFFYTYFLYESNSIYILYFIVLGMLSICFPQFPVLMLSKSNHILAVA